LVPFTGVMLLAIVGASGLNAYFAAQRSQQQVQSQLLRIAGTLQTSPFPLNDSVLRQMRGLSSAEFVLSNEQGDVLASSSPRLGAVASAPPAPATSSFLLGPTIEVAGERYFYTGAKLQPASPEGDRGVLHILYPERIWRESQWDAVMPPLAVGAVALLLVALVSVVITRRLSRPILQLKTQVGRLAEGRFEPIPIPARNDELRELVLSANSLALQLGEMRQVIQRTERLSLLGQLSGGLAHHLRNCVTGARLAVQLHQRHCSDSDRESLGVALRQLALSDEHLQRFLAVGKPQPPQLADVDLAKMFAELDSLVGLTCRHRKIDVQFPALSAPLAIQADAEQLRQLFLNLVLNAIDAASGHGWVRIEVERQPSTLRIRVLDSGLGAPPAVAAKLFEPFVTGKPEGVGLGLAVSRQIAEAHGGSLCYYRDPETCFELTLPLDARHNGMLSGPAATAAAAAASSGAGRPPAALLPHG
jgi:signal transduction histidine kinase